MTFSTWFTFLIAACVIAISPGSGAVLSMSHGLNYGVKKASGTILGLQAGLLLILAVAGAGVGSILMASELAFSVIKTVGALYLIYLGFNQWRARVELVKTEQAPANTQTPDWSRRFLTGFLTNATNPKGIIFMVAVLPQFISHDAPLLPQLLILGITMCSVDLIVMHSYALAASSMQRYFSNPRWLKGQNRFFGGVLMAIGTALFFVKRNPAS
ncbi:LysE family transporter [Undibacterium griseum]|uniref:LysE family transporter n=1 Tax=Undibacterium griseum TaxID=2762295 RepID=A0ABR6YJ50_9BURK|nr:LysE family transporter [Undibacterium griseum]MBC3883854.1 LysE family transporter [Undibacterium griseum]